MTRARDIADQQKNLGGAVAPHVAGKNAVINGGFDIWQRGTSFTTGYGANGGYSADRWQMISGATTGRTFSRQATGDTTNLPFVQYCLRAQRNSGDTQAGGVYYIQVSQSFESVNSIPFAGRAVTVSFYARAGANFSSASNSLSANLRMGTGTDQNAFWSGYTGQVDNSFFATLTTTWQRFSFTTNVGATITEMAVGFQYTPTGTAGAADYFEITGVQLEIGSVATPFSRAGGSIGGELALCQRYYWRNTAPTGTEIASALGRSTTVSDCVINFPVVMRTNPSAVEYGGTISLTDPNVAAYTVTSVTFVHATFYTSFIRPNTASGLTQSKVYTLGLAANAYLGFSAEL